MNSYVTFTRVKAYRFIAYLLDLFMMIGVCYLIDRFFPLFAFDALSADIKALQASSDTAVITQLASSLSQAFATISMKVVIMLESYEFLCHLLFQQTLGKSLFHLKVEKTDVFHTLLRCIVKGITQLFLGGVIFLLSFFSIIASPFDKAIHDRIAKTKVCQG